MDKEKINKLFDEIDKELNYIGKILIGDKSIRADIVYKLFYMMNQVNKDILDVASKLNNTDPKVNMLSVAIDGIQIRQKALEIAVKTLAKKIDSFEVDLRGNNK